MPALIEKCGKFYPMSSVNPDAMRAAAAVFKRSGGVLRTSTAIAQGVHPRTLYGMRDLSLIHI